MDRFVIKTNRKVAEVPVSPNVPDVPAAVATTCDPESETHPAPCELDSNSSNDDEEIVCDESSTKKRKLNCSGKSRQQNFRQEWAAKFPWLEERGKKNFCKPCQKSLTNNVSNLERHAQTDAHARNVASLKSQPQIVTPSAANEYKKKNHMIKLAELRILMFIIQYNLPFIIAEPLITLIKTVATDSAIVKELGFGKGKAQYTTLDLLMDTGLAEISTALRNTKFALIIDESTDVGTNKCLALVARYYDHSKRKVRDRFLSLLQLTECTAQAIHGTILEFFAANNIPISNLVGFASDNASVMVGNVGGVRTLLKANNPNLFVMGCMCHSLHLCSSAAVSVLPPHLEQLTRNIYAYFAHSTKRITELKEIQEMCNVKVHKILRTSSTRWLSLGNVVDRILEQWEPLKAYFLVSEVEVNEDVGKRIYAQLTHTNEAEIPKIHTLIPTIKQYYKTILSNFVQRKYLTDEIYDAEYSVDAKTLSLVDDIYLGPKAANLILKYKVLPSELKEIKKCCRAYYIEICKQILKRVNFNDPMLNALHNLNPMNLGESLLTLLNLFPNLIVSGGMEDIEEEWRELLNNSTVSKSLELVEYWTQVFELKNGLNEYMFPKLSSFIGPLLALPHSSANTERIFSQLQIIKNKKRNRLNVNTVNGIMTAKELLDGVDFSLWKPSSEVLASYYKHGKQ